MWRVREQKRLIVEARIRPEDINYVRPGAEADIRLTAYKQRTTPLVYGSVIYVSGDRMTDPEHKNAAFYIVHVDVTDRALSEAGDLRLTAGMPAAVFIRTDRRSAFDHLTATPTSY